MMPKYVVGCRRGHNREIKVSFSDFDVFKRNTNDTQCWTSMSNIPGMDIEGHICVLPVYIKPQMVQFIIQAGLYDDFSTGSVQEQQLRREGLL